MVSGRTRNGQVKCNVSIRVEAAYVANEGVVVIDRCDVVLVGPAHSGHGYSYNRTLGSLRRR